ACLLTFSGVGSITSASPPSPSITINDVTVTEPNPGGSAFATFTLTLDQAIEEEAWVDVTTVGPSGTATGGDDYSLINNQRVTFQPGDTVKYINVEVYGDTLEENDEFFVITLNNHSSNVNVKGGSGKGTILDNYHPGSFSFLSSGDYSHIEDDW